jgi:hypothetical protein
MGAPALQPWRYVRRRKPILNQLPTLQMLVTEQKLPKLSSEHELSTLRWLWALSSEHELSTPRWLWALSSERWLW